MRIALSQMTCKLGEVTANVQTMREIARAARAAGADAVAFPEMADTGYDMPTILRLAEPADGYARRELAALSAELNITVIAGLSLREGGAVFNTAVVFDPRGNVAAEYRKIHLFSGEPIGEQKHLSPGREISTFPFGDFSAGLMICYDLRFPELARALMRRGVNLMFVAAAWPAVRVAHWKALLTARAIENQMYVLGVNRAGTDAGVELAGNSLAIGYDGEPIKAISMPSADTRIYEVNVGSQQDFRTQFPALRDRTEALFD